ncbi:hypothetical protein D3C71_20240 [compost metagenome]
MLAVPALPRRWAASLTLLLACALTGAAGAQPPEPAVSQKWTVEEAASIRLAPGAVFHLAVRAADGRRGVLEVAPRPLGMYLATGGWLLVDNRREAVTLLGSRGQRTSFVEGMRCERTDVVHHTGCLLFGVPAGTSVLLQTL